MKDILRVCPFCGSDNVMIIDTKESDGYTLPSVFCDNCKIIVSIEDDSSYLDYDEDYNYRKHKTIVAWNRRIR